MPYINIGKAFLLTAFFFTLSADLCAQSVPPSDLFGQEMQTWLRTNWYVGKHRDLGYNGARRAMYSYIDSRADGRVYCVYTGFNQMATNTTFLNPINAEHTVPQSFFSQELPMRSDIHHLYPTHSSVNSARGNNEFDEIADSQTTKWYTGNTTLQTQTTIPTSDIDDYSENISGLFEPREDHKGDLARAVFYFYTMYGDNTKLTRDIESVGALDQLYEWHMKDPVDDWERLRNDRVQERQGNRNPYIDYPNIVAQTYGFLAESTVVSFERPNETIDPVSSYFVTIFTNNAPTEDLMINVNISSSDIVYGQNGFTTQPSGESSLIQIPLLKGQSRAGFTINFDASVLQTNLSKMIDFTIDSSDGYSLGENKGFILSMNGGNLVTGLMKPSESAVNLFPNPAKSFITIDGLEEGANIKIIDLQGRFIKETSLINKQISLTNINPGVYFVYIKNNDLLIRERVIIE